VSEGGRPQGTVPPGAAEHRAALPLFRPRRSHLDPGPRTQADLRAGAAHARVGTTLDAGAGQPLTVQYTPADPNYTAASGAVLITVRYSFSGFLQPVDNPSVLNTARAGVAIPVRFSLAGDQGLTIFAAGSPSVRAVACPKGKTDAIEETASATTSSLIYESSAARYAYVWKTDPTWANSCRSLLVTLKDGNQHEALFKFAR
jgi:hypothetical protein